MLDGQLLFEVQELLHCATGDAVGDGLGDLVGVGVGLGEAVAQTQSVSELQLLFLQLPVT